LNKALDDKRICIEDAKSFLKAISDIHSVFGVFGSEPRTFLAELKDKAIQKTNIDEAQIFEFINERKQARTNKDFKRADEIRDELLAKGIILKDSPDGTTTWSTK